VANAHSNQFLLLRRVVAQAGHVCGVRSRPLSVALIGCIRAELAQLSCRLPIAPLNIGPCHRQLMGKRHGGTKRLKPSRFQ
jgi:hypothetical protein